MMAFLFTRDVIAINKITKNSHNTTYHLVGITERRVHLKGNYEDWIGDIEILMKMPEIYTRYYHISMPC